MRLSLALLLSLVLPAAAGAETLRVAVVVGNNAGSGELPALRWAEADAGKLARTLTEVGQVAPDDLLLLQGRPLADVEKALALAQARVAEAHRAPDARALVLFFFSGHSDGEALELGRERLSFARLKQLLSATGAEVRVSIIDACRSGAAILEKGGRPAPGFTIRLADDLSASGEAMLTSSAADEVALESKEVMGSYFTHHLVSGLRGAADASGDGQITLAEAYRYAYDHTLSSTAATLNGAQHPVYDLRLSGQGELVLASLPRSSAGLELPSGFERALVVDLARDQVVAELTSGSARKLALAPGQYGVRAFRGGLGLGGRFPIAAGQVRPVAWEELTPLEPPKVAKKGPEVESQLGTWETGTALVFSGGICNGITADLSTSFRLSVEFPFLLAVSVSGSRGNGEGAQGTFQESALQLRLGLGTTRWWNSFALRLSAEAGAAYIAATFKGQDAGSALGFVVAPHLGARLGLAGPLFVTFEAEAGAAFVSVDGALHPRPQLSALIGAGLRL